MVNTRMPHEKQLIRRLEREEREAIRDLNEYDRQIRDVENQFRQAVQLHFYEGAKHYAQQLRTLREKRQQRQDEFVSIRIRQGNYYREHVKPLINWKKIGSWFRKWRQRRARR